MNLPISFIIKLNDHSAVRQWIIDNNLTGDVVFNWPFNIITFVDYEYATEFRLRFDVYKQKQRIDKMIEEINDE